MSAMTSPLAISESGMDGEPPSDADITVPPAASTANAALALLALALAGLGQYFLIHEQALSLALAAFLAAGAAFVWLAARDGGYVVLPSPPGRKEREGTGKALVVFEQAVAGRDMTDHCLLLFMEPEKGVTVTIPAIAPLFAQRFPRVRTIGTLPRDPHLLSAADEDQDRYVCPLDLKPYSKFSIGVHQVVVQREREGPASGQAHPKPREAARTGADDDALQVLRLRIVLGEQLVHALEQVLGPPRPLAEHVVVLEERARRDVGRSVKRERQHVRSRSSSGLPRHTAG